MIPYFQADSLSDLPGIRHGFFTRKGGVSEPPFDTLNCGLSSNDDPARIAENRKRVAEELGVKPENLLSCHQIHSNKVVRVERERPWEIAARPQADGMVTRVPGIALGALSADCVPVLFADPLAKVIGAAHAGWRGAVGGVLEATVEAMVGLGAKREQICAAIGPCIWQESYEVGPEFPIPFLQESEENRRFFKDSGKRGHFLFNLPGYALAKLTQLGLAKVTPSLANTWSDAEHFFSYRRNCQQGEKNVPGLISAIALVS